MSAPSDVRTLKADALGSVERVVVDGTVCVRRVARGGRVPGSRWVARRLLARERRALERLARLDGVPALVAVERGTLTRSWIDGVPLSHAAELPVDFFDELDALVARVHEAGVCHNDLHKEQNVLVRADGRPALVDFQLASRHGRASALYRSRVRDDLRHVQKHRRRYLKPGRGPGGEHVADEAELERLRRGAGHGLGRSRVAWLWRRLGKPVYVLVTRRLLRTRDGEERRPSSGPWPRWTAPVGGGGARGPEGESDAGAAASVASPPADPKVPRR